MIKDELLKLTGRTAEREVSIEGDVDSKCRGPQIPAERNLNIWEYTLLCVHSIASSYEYGALEPHCLGLHPSSAIYQPWDMGQVTQSPCTSVASYLRLL